MDLSVFKGRLPYASELFGIYQPLMGWKSKLIQQRLQVAALSTLGFPSVFTVVDSDRIQVKQGPADILTIDGDGDVGPVMVEPDVFKQVFAHWHVQPPAWLDGLIVRSLESDITTSLVEHPPEDTLFWREYWKDALGKDHLNKTLRNALDTVKGDDKGFFMPRRPSTNDRLADYIVRVRAQFATRAEAVDHVFNKEAYVARFLHSLLPDVADPVSAAKFPANVHALLFAPAPAMDYGQALAQLDPMALAVGAGREAVLSPLGIVNIFRQYFFEFGTFLGPPVEHIWLSPGSMTELIEVSTRRVLQERTFEELTERIWRTETSTTNEDELATAIRDENQKNTKLGASLSGGATILIAHVEASGSTSIEDTQRRAREENHRALRQQSAKLSTEIRSNYKSTFRTVTETTDTRSKRYVIKNDSPDLVNYELRRKMRSVCVQMQDIGTQLCWQVYIDDPGAQLGVGQLVHLASKADLSQYAALTPKAEPKAVTEVITILLPVPKAGERSTMGPIAAAGFIGLTMASLPGAAVGVAVYEVLDSLFGDDDPPQHAWYSIDPPKTIHQPFKLALPEGYQIASGAAQVEDDVFKKDAGIADSIPVRWLGKNGMKLKFHMTVLNPGEGTMDLVVNGGDVTPGEIIEFQAQITISPTPAKINAVAEENKGVAEENKKREIERERRIKEELVKSVKERVRIASAIASRKSEDLREEERTVVFRKLISQLMRDAWSTSVSRPLAHLRSELVKSLFDVDKMLYFVAPEWWQPRRHRSSLDMGADIEKPLTPGFVAAATATATVTAAARSAAKMREYGARSRLGTLGTEDIVGWGGEGRGDNYLLTEDSTPARLGSSLGWLLQLDGDNLRNAFLNAPWVKAVVPIRPGREQEALEWLKQSQVEGTEGLGEVYAGEDQPLFAGKYKARHGVEKAPTVGEVLELLALDIAEKHRQSLEVVTTQGVSYVPPDEVYERGFDPLVGGFRAEWDGHFQSVDQWVEVLPTDQIVAVEVQYDPKTGLPA